MFRLKIQNFAPKSIYEMSSRDPSLIEDIYSFQREELLELLRSLSSRHEPLSVHGNILLWADDIPRVLEKMKNRNHFSRKERHALTEAGFNLELMYPGL